jgi:hypothetical protein
MIGDVITDGHFRHSVRRGPASAGGGLVCSQANRSSSSTRTSDVRGQPPEPRPAGAAELHPTRGVAAAESTRRRAQTEEHRQAFERREAVFAMLHVEHQGLVEGDLGVEVVDGQHRKGAEERRAG